MDIKQLKFLIALEQTRHFGQAAARCHLTQPTLSMRLRNLEDELDLVLVTRGQRFEGFTEVGETRVGLLYDNRHFHFDGTQMNWEEAAELALGMRSNGMHYRKSIDLSFRSRGLDPQPILESDSTYQLLQAIHEGFCCAIMPLDSGLEEPIEARYREQLNLGGEKLPLTDSLKTIEDVRRLQMQPSSAGQIGRMRRLCNALRPGYSHRLKAFLHKEFPLEPHALPDHATGCTATPVHQPARSLPVLAQAWFHQFRRAGGADFDHASGAGRTPALDLRAALSACPQLLHVAARA
nr:MULTISPECIES: LysR family transcriptional regulator [unclassified Pseudomonas]